MTVAMEPDREACDLAEASQVIHDLRQRLRTQGQILVSCKKRLEQQNVQLLTTQKSRRNDIQHLSAQLLWFESQLKRKQVEIDQLLAARDETIRLQQKRINRLKRRTKTCQCGGSSNKQDGVAKTKTIKDPDSLNDSDSAIMLEESLDSAYFNTNDVKVIRSVSDAVKIANIQNKKDTSEEQAEKIKLDKDKKQQRRLERQKSLSWNRYNGLVRRPDVLETVYSVEEEEAEEKDKDEGEETVCVLEVTSDLEFTDEEMKSSRLRSLSCETSPQRLPASCSNNKTRDKPKRGSKTDDDMIQVTYNRVMTNHRSVVKPKDVKYKRINKAKSRSLEELRGRLKNWVDKGQPMRQVKGIQTGKTCTKLSGKTRTLIPSVTTDSSLA